MDGASPVEVEAARAGATLAAIVALAIAGGLAARAGGPVRPLGLGLAAAGLLVLPLAASPGPSVARFVAAVAAAGALLKLVDLARRPAEDARATLLFLLHPLSGARRLLPREPRAAPAAAARLAARGLLVALAGAALVRAAWSDVPVRAGVVAEHAARVGAAYVVVFGLADLLAGLVRLTGQPARDLFDRPWLAVTPADFWRRYNRVVGQALLENVFVPAGGRRHPVRATLLAFVASAAMHEWLLGVTLGRVEGTQTAFFLLQGLGAAATLGVRPRRGLARAAGIVLTFAFNLATSFLFFASVDRIVPLWTVRPL